MGNALFQVDGIDVAALVAEHLGPRVLPCVLYKHPAAAARDPADPTQAGAVGAPTQHTCRGLIEDFSPVLVDGSAIKVGDRRVILLGDTIKPVVVPEGGVNKDQVLVEGTRYNVHRVLSRDPAGATYVLQVRRP